MIGCAGVRERRDERFRMFIIRNMFAELHDQVVNIHEIQNRSNAVNYFTVIRGIMFVYSIELQLDRVVA